MKIYTKTGDKGQTSLWDGERVDKDSLRVECYGTIDELNATLGMARSVVEDKEMKDLILGIQRKLFYVGGELATRKEEKKFYSMQESDIEELEKIIDSCIARIDGVDKFIIAGSTQASAQLDFSRTVARRAERLILRLNKEEEINPNLIKYVNRLSDAIYSIERYLEDELIYFESGR